MNSCLYECQMWHSRLTPQFHRFSYRIFLFALDLDELDILGRSPFFSAERRNLYSFHDRDFFPTDEPQYRPTSSVPSPSKKPSSLSLKERVLQYVAERGVDLHGGRVILVTLPRVLGALFNPVSLYFCYDRDGQAVASIAEVTNTFRERKLYFLGPETRTSEKSQVESFRLRRPKHFYVSPFSDVDVEFEFRLQSPHDRLAAQIDNFIGDTRTFSSSLQGQRRALTSSRLAWYTFKYPALSLQILARIHWHALRLWLKKVPWFAKATRASDQREVYRAHHSLTRSSRELSRPLTPISENVRSLEPLVVQKTL